MYLNNNICTTL